VKVLLVLLTLCASDAQDQVWPEVDVYAGTGHNTRLNFLYSSTRVHEEGYSDGQLGVNMDFYFSPLEGRILHRHADVVRNHLLVLRVGYLFEKTPSDAASALPSRTSNRRTSSD
jgi:hypothetical protein